MPKIKVMITGNRGFIGTHLTNYLSEKDNFEVVGFDIKNSPLEDIRNEKYINDFMNKHKPEIVIHLAANPDVSTSTNYPEFDSILNIAGTINMLEASKKHNIGLFIFSSTAQVCGEPKAKKMDESHPLNPKSPYAISKLASERYVNFYYEKYNLPTTIFRFFNIFGEGQLDWAVVPNLIKKMTETKIKEFKMYGSKQDSRDFIYVKDVCRVFELAIDKKPVGQVINIGTGKEILIINLAKKIASLLGKKFDYKYSGQLEGAKVNRLKADITKAKNILGWEPKYSLEQGLINILKNKGHSIKEDK